MSESKLLERPETQEKPGFRFTPLSQTESAHYIASLPGMDGTEEFEEAARQKERQTKTD